MAAPYILKWDQTFGNGMRTLFSKQLIKRPRILFTSKRASIGDFSSEISSAKGRQLYPSVCSWTDKKLTMNSSSCIMHEHIFCLPD